MSIKGSFLDCRGETSISIEVKTSISIEGKLP